MRSTNARARILVSVCMLAVLAGCVHSRGVRSPQTADPIEAMPRPRASARPTPIAAVAHRPVEATRPEMMVPEHEAIWAPGATRERRPRARTTAQPSLISLYGDELVGGTHNVATPFDGSANTSQVSFATEGATFDPHVDRSGRFIVFASTRHRPTADIYLKSTTGTAVTQLTSDPAQDIMPCFDPDAKRIAYASNRSGDWDIYIQPVSGGQPMRLTSDPEPELHPTWSPDGRTIAYCKFGSRSGRWELWTVEVDNPSTPRILTYGVFPEWSPDPLTNKILFQRARQRGSHYHSIWTIDLADGEAVRPTEILSAGNAALINPSWSPDAKRVTFVTVVDPEQQPHPPTLSDVWSVNLDGSNPTNLTNGKFANYQPVWAGTGTVYFVSNRSGVDNIWAVGTTAAPDAGPGGVATVDPDRNDDAGGLP